MRLILFTFCLLFTSASIHAQTETEQISKTLMDYIEGTANGEPDRLREAFDKDFNLYFVKDDSLQVWSGEGYINRIKKGKKNNRIGRIISIDFENNAASAKVEIDMPGMKRIYTDYFLLLKMEGRWKIVHKSFTFRPYPEHKEAAK
ncbi:MAG: nuclear transport factor 2 family protein [Saprospiraceae bacterium]|nr:nuclear transport factor 2 family protein [Saprospiraceae bacterium]